MLSKEDFINRLYGAAHSMLGASITAQEMIARKELEYKLLDVLSEVNPCHDIEVRVYTDFYNRKIEVSYFHHNRKINHIDYLYDILTRLYR